MNEHWFVGVEPPDTVTHYVYEDVDGAEYPAACGVRMYFSGCVGFVTCIRCVARMYSERLPKYERSTFL